jgi:hypothetical protein
VAVSPLWFTVQIFRSPSTAAPTGPLPTGQLPRSTPAALNFSRRLVE